MCISVILPSLSIQSCITSALEKNVLSGLSCYIIRKQMAQDAYSSIFLFPEAFGFFSLYIMLENYWYFSLTECWGSLGLDFSQQSKQIIKADLMC